MRYLKDPLLWFVLVLMLLLVANNVPHLGNKYWELPNGHTLPRWQAWAAVALFEAFIILLDLMKTRNVWPWFFTVILFLLSASQWDFAGMLETASYDVLSATQDIAPALLFSLFTTIPVPIVGKQLVKRLDAINDGARELIELRQQVNELQRARDEDSMKRDEASKKAKESQRDADRIQRTLEAERESTAGEMERVKADLNEKQSLLNEALTLLDEWTRCYHCGSRKDTPNSVRAHLKGCAHKTEKKVEQRHLTPTLREVLESFNPSHQTLETS